MKAYKGFDKNMKCRGFQFEEGKEYSLPEGEKAKLCEKGFHACEDPLDCLSYYAPADSVYHEVELDATDEKSSDSKRVGSRIKIGAAIDIAKIVKAHFEYVKERCDNNKQGGDRSALTGGDRSALTGGYRSALTGGDRSALTGGYRSALTGGDRSVLRGGEGSKFKGGMGSVFAVEVRHKQTGKLLRIKTAVVDGKNIKPDTWYVFDGKKWTEEGEDGD